MQRSEADRSGRTVDVRIDDHRHDAERHGHCRGNRDDDRNRVRDAERHGDDDRHGIRDRIGDPERDGETQRDGIGDRKAVGDGPAPGDALRHHAGRQTLSD